MITSVLCAIAISFNVFTSNDLIGKWSLDTGQGPIVVEFKSDNSYEVDLGNDGQIDIIGDYKLNGNQVIINDRPGDTSCEEEGIYSFSVEGNTLTMKKVKDDCPNRGSSEAMVMTKV